LDTGIDLSQLYPHFGDLASELGIVKFERAAQIFWGEVFFHQRSDMLL